MRLSILAGAIALLCAPTQGSRPGALLDRTVWDPDVRLTRTGFAATPVSGDGRQVAVDREGRVHVVWMDLATGNTLYRPQVWYKRWYPGPGWTADTMISGDTGDAGPAQEPALAADSAGDVHLVYRHLRSEHPAGLHILYKRCSPTASGNGGWDLASTRLDQSSASWTKQNPAVATTPDGNVHVVWHTYDASPGHILHYRERIGANWQDQVAIDSGHTAYWQMWQPAIAGDRDNNIHVAMYGRLTARGGSYYYPYYRARYGTAWTDWVDVTGRTGYCVAGPSIAVNPINNHLSLAWRGYGPGLDLYRIMHKQKLGPGANDTFQLTADTICGRSAWSQEGGPSLAFTANGVGHAVWHGPGPDSPTRPRVRYNHRDRSGTWGDPYSLPEGEAPSRFGSIAAGGGPDDPDLVHVVWTDSRHEGSELYYKRGESDTTAAAVADPGPGQPTLPMPGPSIIRGVLMLPGLGTPGAGLGTRPELSDNSVMSRAVLLDATGRKVMDLQPGENDVRHLAPGVYFIRTALWERSQGRDSVRKVVIQR